MRIPKEGTNLRTLYDYLQRARGRWIPYPEKIPNTSRSRYYAQLRDFYGLDIRCRQVGLGFPNKTNEVLLAGESRDNTYVDFCQSKEPVEC